MKITLSLSVERKKKRKKKKPKEEFIEEFHPEGDVFSHLERDPWASLCDVTAGPRPAKQGRAGF